MGAKKLAGNFTFYDRSKHIDIKYHFIRNALKDDLVELKHIPSEDMVALYFYVYCFVSSLKFLCFKLINLVCSVRAFHFVPISTV